MNGSEKQSKRLVVPRCPFEERDAPLPNPSPNKHGGDEAKSVGFSHAELGREALDKRRTSKRATKGRIAQLHEILFLAISTLLHADAAAAAAAAWAYAWSAIPTARA